MSEINIKEEKDIIILSLNRPQSKNAITFAMLNALISFSHSIKKNPQVRAVIIHGEGNNFSSGIDLNDINAKKNSKKIIWQFIKLGKSIFQKAPLHLRAIPVPVICAIDGYCLGAGLQLALGCDIRIAHPNSNFSIMEAKWGLIPDMGITKTSLQLIPIDILKELTFTARFFDSQSAKNYNIVTHIDENPLDYAKKLAQEIINSSPDTLVAIKKLYNLMPNSKTAKLLRLEKIWQLKMLLSKNQKIATKKNKNKELKYFPRKYK